MIPVCLRLKNFLSYREATLDFRGLHVACVCGSNGAGKSSLLEAIAWAVWGQSRAHTEDNVIHMGEQEALVDFTFLCHQQTYRIIRARYRGQASALEFQIQTNDGFRTLTGRGMRATQQLINQYLRLDYDTFVNSAYLRQGRADEFMLKRPSERKQVLADLLKLDQYDQLADQAKEQARQLEAEVVVLDRTLEAIAQQLEAESSLMTHQQHLETVLTELRHQQETARAQLKQLQQQQQQRQTWQQELALQQQQQQHLRQECDRLQHEQTTLQHQIQRVEAVLAEAGTITEGYGQFQALQMEEDRQASRLQRYQVAEQQRQRLYQQQTEAIASVRDQQRQVQIQYEALVQQEQDLIPILKKSEQIATALQQLHQAQETLTRLDQLQVRTSPLIQRRQQLQHQLEQHGVRLSARLDELRSSAQMLHQRHEAQPAIQQAVLDVASQLEYLEKRRHYQQQVREKGTERRSFMERLQEKQRDLERQLAELDQKRRMLESPKSEETQIYPPCPLCDRPLDASHWQLVLKRHQEDYQEVQSHIWVIREQLSASEKEIQILRQEYRDVDQELIAYQQVLEQRGRLQEQIHTVEHARQQLEGLLHEQQQLERQLQGGDYGVELREELHRIDQTLQQLSYDEKNHALARGQVDQWRWAEIKQAELQQAQKRRSRILTQKAELETQMKEFTEQLAALEESPIQHDLRRLDQELAAIRYDPDVHAQVRQALRQAQAWPSRYQDLLQARQQHPSLHERLRAIAQTLTERHDDLHAVEQHLDELCRKLGDHPDPQEAIQAQEMRLEQGRSQLDEHLAHLGRLQQQQQQLDGFKQQQDEHQQQVSQLRYQIKLYRELAKAFGKNGIQALMIENVLPQLEAEANHILGRLSANQLHIQFVTQRASRSQSKSARKVAAKLIDTLDILIGNTQGTRPYETYSGGEAFRVNFAIRLALARLLAQRSGTALQMLIVDEGFGTQDQAGCDRLVSSINAIASDFSCILTVTHMPHLKEAFQTRIEVVKTLEGSRLNIVS